MNLVKMRKDKLLGQSLFGPWSRGGVDACNADWTPLAPALEANVERYHLEGKNCLWSPPDGGCVVVY